MDHFDIPLFKKSYDLYKTLYGYRLAVPKLDRYGIWQKTENTLLEVIEHVLLASQKAKQEKISHLEQASSSLNLLRVFIRLMKDTKALDMKKYLILEVAIEEIGRMLGGWIKSTKE
ncbi:MAG: four helix bundle protein [Patescibacteria group bacterium]